MNRDYFYASSPFKKELFLYSNEFEESLNPAQFKNKKAYRPSGIMDPYNN